MEAESPSPATGPPPGRSSPNTWHALLVAAALTVIPFMAAFALPLISRLVGAALGWYLRRKTAERHAQLLRTMTEEEAEFRSSGTTAQRGRGEDGPGGEKGQAGVAVGEGREWDGFVGFFHPFCNAGGGGERVLWAAIRATQERWPRAKCVVYTGDHDASKEAILKRVKTTFNIDLHAPTVAFLYLTTRRWVLASTWPHFTLLGQSLGSIVLAWDAFGLLVPDMFVDTMGYAFTLALCRFLFGAVIPVGAYVHYPTISTDMLRSLSPSSGQAAGPQGVNAGQGTGLRGAVKTAYWRLFARLYGRVGTAADVVMTNSSWTQSHIQAIWGPARAAAAASRGRRLFPIEVVYPPVAVPELKAKIDVSAESEGRREKVLLYIAQFRPEKNHRLVIEAFSKFVRAGGPADACLVLVGGVRDDADSKWVYQLRLLVNELGVRDRVKFHLDATWAEILDWLGRASVGVNGMWNEHFGIGVVEYQAAGLISVVHDSGGPKMDIVTEVDGGATGFHATTVDEFADGFRWALSLRDPLEVRRRARHSAERFTEEAFAGRWVKQMERLVAMAPRSG